jgi:AcrR family transcriptional regulator
MTRQARAALTRKEVMRSAAQVFEQLGYARSSIGDISRAARVSNGALYFHFKSKEALATAVQKAAWEAIGVLIRPTGPPPASSLQHLIDTSGAVSALLRDDIVVRAGYHLACDPLVGSGRSAHLVWYRFVRSALERAKRDDSLPDGVPVDDLAAVVTAATVGLEALGHQDPRWLDTAVLDRCWARLLS